MKTQLILCLALTLARPALAQLAPGQADLEQYQGLFAAVARGDNVEVEQLIKDNGLPEIRDAHARTPLLIATHLGDTKTARILLDAGADANTMDVQRYDLITIAAVNNDVEMIRLGLEFGANPGAVTSPYEGTALIAAAHLGHVETVQTLIEAGAPLDHVNNLGWTALIESIVLGDGGNRHTQVLKLLVDAGANTNLVDRRGISPLTLAHQNGFDKMIVILNQAGAQ